ncbi:MAG: hypothetical protein DCC49_08480, partial [Acidobacteria bacterium]
ILVLCDRDWTHPEAGGAGLNLGSQVQRWLADGHGVRVLTVKYPGAPEFENHGDLEIYRRGGIFTVFAWTTIRLAIGIASDVDVVLEVINGVPWFSRFMTGKPTVAMIHHVCSRQFDQEVPEPFRSVGKFLESTAMPRVYSRTPMITVSESSAEEIANLGMRREDITVIHNGLDPSAYATDAGLSEVPTLLYVGRLRKYKRVDLLIKLFARVVEFDPAVRLEIAGEGNYRPQLEELARRLGVRDKVSFLGFISEDEKIAALARAWVSVTASDVEGWGLSVMEGAACSTPSVAFRLSGLAESVLHGRTGFLADNEDEFVSYCLELLENEALRTEMGEQARLWASEFDWGRTADETIRVLARSAGRYELITPGRFEVHSPDPRANPSAVDGYSSRTMRRVSRG